MAKRTGSISEVMRDSMVFDLEVNKLTQRDLASKYKISYMYACHLSQQKWYRERKERILDDAAILKQLQGEFATNYPVEHLTKFLFTGQAHRCFAFREAILYPNRTRKLVLIIKELHDLGFSDGTLLNAFVLTQDELYDILDVEQVLNRV